MKLAKVQVAMRSEIARLTPLVLFDEEMPGRTFRTAKFLAEWEVRTHRQISESRLSMDSPRPE